MKRKLPLPLTSVAPDFFSPQVSEARRFYLDLNPPAGCRLAVVCGGVERSAPGYAIHRVTFPYHSIEYVVRGRGRLRMRGREHGLEPGVLFAYGPGIPHDIEGDDAEPLVKYFVDFAGTRAAALLKRCRLSPGSVSRAFPPDELRGLFDELIRCGRHGARHAGAVCAGLLECIGLHLLDSRVPPRGGESRAFGTFRQCQDYIRAHALGLRTLRQIASECHLDAAYLCRLFRRYDHQSPYRFLMRLKMNAAAEWLQQPGLLVKQVATQVGFEDPFHFSRAFKSVFGVAPETFRRMRGGQVHAHRDRP
jgi:AraC-like DNA-binding protein/quercetin dioxygenase-like cupin family protein